MSYLSLQVVYERTISDLSSLMHVGDAGPSLPPIPCHLVDQAGSYQARLRWSRDRTEATPTGTGSSSLVVAESGKMAASWSEVYNLSTDAHSVFPCDENAQLTVEFSQPVCAGDHDKARP